MPNAHSRGRRSQPPRQRRSGRPRGGEASTPFDAQVDYWDEVYDRPDLDGLIYRDRRRRVLRLVDALELRLGVEVLDVGCGPGRLLVALLQRGLVVSGVDSSENMVAAARRRLLTQDPTAAKRLIRADVTTLPYSDGRFFLTTAIGLLPWVADWRGALSELARVTAPGGYVIATADNAFRLNHLLDPALTPIVAPLRAGLKRMLLRTRPEQGQFTGMYLRRAEIEAAAVTAGLEVVAWEPVGFGPFTFLRRLTFHDRDGQRLHRRLQARADAGDRFLRSTATQLLFSAVTAVAGESTVLPGNTPPPELAGRIGKSGKRRLQ